MHVKMRSSHRRKIVCCCLFIIMLIIFLHPSMNARDSYEYITKANILDSLLEETANFTTNTAIPDCNYHDIIYDDTILSPSLVDGDLIEGHKIKEGGEHAPSSCKPKFSTAVIVPYRDRAEELRGFLVYMHMLFRRQRIHYRIYVVEQVDSQPFNRAKLLNIGAAAAMKAGYPCLILHDVDLLPLKPANLYACTKQPRHMSSNINRSRFILSYLNLFGGVIAITSKQYKAFNGMSNEYYDLGGDDEELYSRIESIGLKLCRFEPDISTYHMTTETDKKQERKPDIISSTKKKISEDGLSSLQFTEVATVLHPLFTHIMVDL